MMLLYDNRYRLFPSYGHIDGPTVNNNSMSKSNKTSNIYDVLGSSVGDSGSGSGVGVRLVQQQPFDMSPTLTSTAHNNTAFKFPGGMMMAATLEFPFKFSQYKELERQVMIFKYMKASIPVPIDLLIPITGNPSLAVAGGGLNLTFSGGGDVEPGRCKRTDGKKWRCSRDVAPDQKYCERHLHRARPRSRKPVEVLPNKKARHSQNQALPSSSSSSAVLTKNASQHQFFGTLPQPSEKAATFWPLTSVSRTSDWTMNEELIPLADQQWDNLMQIETATNYDKEPLNLMSCPNFNGSVDQERNGFPWFDAWSNGAEASVSCNGFHHFLC